MTTCLRCISTPTLNSHAAALRTPWPVLHHGEQDSNWNWHKLFHNKLKGEKRRKRREERKEKRQKRQRNSRTSPPQKDRKKRKTKKEQNQSAAPPPPQKKKKDGKKRKTKKQQNQSAARWKTGKDNQLNHRKLDLSTVWCAQCNTHPQIHSVKPHNFF